MSRRPHRPRRPRLRVVGDVGVQRPVGGDDDALAGHPVATAKIRLQLAQKPQQLSETNKIDLAVAEKILDAAGERPDFISRTVDEKKVALRIPAGTQSGTRFRISGQGVEKSGRRGDQYVQVKVDVPATLTPEQERLMKEFADAAELRY